MCPWLDPTVCTLLSQPLQPLTTQREVGAAAATVAGLGDGAELES